MLSSYGDLEFGTRVYEVNLSQRQHISALYQHPELIWVQQYCGSAGEGLKGMTPFAHLKRTSLNPRQVPHLHCCCYSCFYNLLDISSSSSSNSRQKVKIYDNFSMSPLCSFTWAVWNIQRHNPIFLKMKFLLCFPVIFPLSYSFYVFNIFPSGFINPLLFLLRSLKHHISYKISPYSLTVMYCRLPNAEPKISLVTAYEQGRIVIETETNII